MENRVLNLVDNEKGNKNTKAEKKIKKEADKWFSLYIRPVMPIGEGMYSATFVRR